MSTLADYQEKEVAHLRSTGLYIYYRCQPMKGRWLHGTGRVIMKEGNPNKGQVFKTTVLVCMGTEER